MPATRLRIFVSSAQREFAQVRADLQAMIALCREAGLSEPDFELRQGFFVLTLWRDRLTAEMLAALRLNDRQLAGLELLRSEGRLTSGRYQELTAISRQTAARDLEEMVHKGILERHGRGRGAFYLKAKGMPQK